MIQVRCFCVDDTKKPSVIPAEKWVEKDKMYHITHIFVMKNQNGIQGCELAEHDISMHSPYNCYRLNRFAIVIEDLGKLVELIKQSDQYNQLSDFDIQKYVDDLEVKKELV